MLGLGPCLQERRKIMSEWIENSNGNHVYVIDTDDLMTVYKRGDEWFGVYDNRFTEDGFVTSGKAMAFMEKTVLGDRLDLLVKRKPMPTGWRKTKTGGYHCIRGGGTMTVKTATSGKWYLIVNQSIVRDKWFDTEDEAMLLGDQL
jgi:glucan-binding YG repeat protein